VRYLLDTHTFLWFLTDDKRLSSRAKGIIEDINNVIFLSSASVWELSIKSSIGKIKFFVSLEEIINTAMNVYDFKHLPITIQHSLEVAKLPLYHRDPFDRVLIAQARVENMVLITCDSYMKQYDVNVIW
jgi:PIN domain nuclease of toxin-antitoxin system